MHMLQTKVRAYYLMPFGHSGIIMTVVVAAEEPYRLWSLPSAAEYQVRTTRMSSSLDDRVFSDAVALFSLQLEVHQGPLTEIPHPIIITGLAAFPP